MPRVETEDHGDGHLDLERLAGEFESEEERARFAANHDGCPVPEKTIERETEAVAKARDDEGHPERYRDEGALRATEIYSRYMTFYQLALRELRERAERESEQGGEEHQRKARWWSGLADYLTQPIARKEGEKIVGWEDGAIPEWAFQFVPPTERYENYVLARLLASYVFDWGRERRQDPLATAFECLSKAIDLLDPEKSNEENAYILVMATAENMVSWGHVKPALVIKRLFSAGKLRQDSFYEEYSQALKTMENLESRNPRWMLSRRYWNMRSWFLKKNGIAELSEFLGKSRGSGLKLTVGDAKES